MHLVYLKYQILWISITERYKEFSSGPGGYVTVGEPPLTAVALHPERASHG